MFSILSLQCSTAQRNVCNANKYRTRQQLKSSKTFVTMRKHRRGATSNNGIGADMTEKEFMNEVIQRLSVLEQTKGMNIQCQTFIKNNNTKRYAIVLHQEESMVSPAIYMERYYKEYQKQHITLDMAAESIAHVVEKVRTQAREYYTLSLDFEDCREHIVYRLISREMNEDLVECIPNIPFLDLMITFYVVIRRSSKGIDIFQITNALIKEWDVSVAELFRLAEENTPRLFPPKVEPMADILEQYLGIQPDEIRELPMTIMGNEAGVYLSLIHI